MKWPIFFSGVAIAVTVGLCYWLLPSAEKQAVQRVSDQKKAVGRLLPISSASASSPQAMTVISVSQPQKTTTDRRRVYDSPDIMATIYEVRHHGTPDERDWAIRLLSSCAVLFQMPPAPMPDAQGGEAPKPASKSLDKALEAQKKRALQSLTERCRGVKALNHDDRVTLRRELLEPAASYMSALRELNSLSSEVRDGRWSEEQAQLITKSLYSGDPIVARDAFRAMLAAMDWNAPGGKDRLDAFMLAVGGIYDKGPLTEYERLEACYTMGWCKSGGGDQDTTYAAPSVAVLQMASKYTAAINSHMDARGLMGLR